MVRKALNISYAYSATQNNGKITSETDALSMEQVLYTYDSLNRLASAQTAGAGGWGQSYTYDGFGNLTDQTLIKGTAPDVHVAYNYLTNRQTGDTADANGNIGSTNVYDIDNRLVQPSSGAAGLYAYDPSNKRVWRWNASGLDELTFWAGQKLATYQISVDGGGVWFTLTSTNVNFGGKLVSKGTYNSSGTGDKVSLTPVVADRLGSVGKFYPYGVERPSATQNDKEKFTGYFRDASTGLDYADQRYEQPGMGRFMTADPLASSANASDPGSQNRYAYVGGDPVNRVDPKGQDWWDWSWDPYYNDPWFGGNTGDSGYQFDVGAYVSTILAQIQPLSDAYYASYDLLQPLFNQGLISDYSIDFWSGGIDITFTPDVYNDLLQIPFPIPLPADPTTIEKEGKILISIGLGALEAIREWLQVRRLLTVRADCSVHQVGTPDHASAGTISATGRGPTYNSAVSAAYSAAQAAVQAQFGVGFHAQHCGYTQVD